MKKIIVIGGGASGIMAAIRAAEHGAQVTLFEKMPKIGRKLSITGKGRCNITNAADISEVIKNIQGNGKFLYSALNDFSPSDTINFFESLGVKTKIERGGRIFPVSDDAKEVIEALIKKMAVLDIEFKTNSPVTDILVENKKIVGVIVGGKIFKADCVILATGGASYPATGSSGDGFKFAKKIGHTITKILPSLVPLEVEEEFISDLQGLSLKNVRVKLLADGKKVAEQFGEMLFTHFGVSGPIILTLSRQAAKLLAEKNFVELEINLKPALSLEQLEMLFTHFGVSGPIILTLSRQAAKLLAEKNFVELEINLKPALSLEQLDARILRDFDKFKGKIIKNALVKLLPTKLISPVLDLSYLPEEKRVDEITSAERRRLVESLRGLPLTITKTRPIEEAIVTSGGISVKEINPRTMESKIVKNLFIVGEVADVDGFTGGFNLQAAWAMGNAAGKFASK